MKYFVLAKSAAGSRATFTLGKLALVADDKLDVKPFYASVGGPGADDTTYYVPSTFNAPAVTALVQAYRDKLGLERKRADEQERWEAEQRRREEATEAFIGRVALLDHATLTDETAWPAARVKKAVLTELQRRNASLIQRVQAAAEERFGALRKRAATVASPTCSQVDMTRSVHMASKIFVQTVQRWCERTEGVRSLNLVRGVDLLGAVGKLSHMINNADIAENSQPLVPSIHDLFKFQRARIGGFTRAAPTGAPIDLILSLLDPASFLRLSATSRSFLYAFAFYPPTGAMADELSEGMPRLWLKRAQTALALGSKPWAGLGNLQALANHVPRVRAQGLGARLTDVLAEPQSGAQASVEWGAAQQTTFELAGAIRLNFCEDLRVVRSHVDSQDDLQYSSIALSLDKDPIRTHQIQLAFKDLSKLKGSFIGEACILMVSLEGTMNNLMVADVPFASQLIAHGELTWKQALYVGPGQLASIPFASGKGAKPQSVMSKQAALLKRKPVKYDAVPRHLSSYEDFTLYMAEKKSDATPARYEKELALVRPEAQEALFAAYMAKEYELHERFFRAFFPAIYECHGGLQALLAGLVTAEFLCETYAVGGELKAQVDKEIAACWNRLVVRRAD